MKDKTICVVGLGYVGLPLAIEFGKKFRTLAFDINKKLIENYKNKIDTMGEISKEDFDKSKFITFTSNPHSISDSDYIIIAVPTPITKTNIPDFTPLINASITVGNYMKEGCTVIYESTVFPGATKEIYIPVLEKNSGKKWKLDFNVSYSPERINPGDEKHTLTKVVKLVSGDTKETLNNVKELYSEIIKAGVYPTSSIEVAESAKVIENIQRDVNIALVNELAMIFDKLNINTTEVLNAAKTKWNFLDFTPGLVGGHCIGVDPYYLTQKAEEIGYHSEIILAGRRINDGMSKFIVSKIIKNLIKSGCNNINNSAVCIFGLTFKANCADLRNSKVFDIIKEFNEYGMIPYVYDPWVDFSKLSMGDYRYQISFTNEFPKNSLDSIIVAVDHNEFKDLSPDYFSSCLKTAGWLFDIKSIYNKNNLNKMGINNWQL